MVKQSIHQQKRPNIDPKICNGSMVPLLSFGVSLPCWPLLRPTNKNFLKLSQELKNPKYNEAV
jgi:hypothetical protein